MCSSEEGSLLLFPDGKVTTGEKTWTLVADPQENGDKRMISWPGEYDYNGISIRGIGKGENDQVSYIVTAEGIRMGFISSPMQDFTEKDEEIIGDLDILVVPADDAKKAQNLIEEIDPRVVIPVKTKDEKVFKEVIAACGGKDVETVKEVKFKKSTLPSETREVYVLE